MKFFALVSCGLEFGRVHQVLPVVETKCGLTVPQNRLFFIENGFHQAKFGAIRVQNETILNVFPSSNDRNRLVLVRTTTICGLEHLVLRQETFSADVGWFVQSCVAIEPSQVAELKMTLAPGNVNRGRHVTAATGSRSSMPSHKTTRGRANEATPIILQFEAAS